MTLPAGPAGYAFPPMPPQRGLHSDQEDEPSWFTRPANIGACVTGGIVLLWFVGWLLLGGSSTPQVEAWPVAAVALPSFPEPAVWEPVQSGVRLAEVRLPGGPQPGHSGKLWVYLPEGEHAPHSLGCVFLAPAGTNMFTGIELSEGDRVEHLPYVQAGMAVVAYELDGGLHDLATASDAEMKSAFQRFQAAQGGMVNARIAVEYALARLPQVDPQRLYTAGHSSAGSMSLLAAAYEPRIRACVAYAPCSDIADRFGTFGLLEMQSTVGAGAKEFARRNSPMSYVAQLKCPVFVFHAEDDENCEIRQSKDLVKALLKHGCQAELSTIKTGGHYDPMISKGIPRAIEWLKHMPAGR